MDKNTKRIAYVVLILLILSFAFTFFQMNSNLSKAIHNIEASRDTINTAVEKLHVAEIKIHEVQEELQSLKKMSLRSEIQVKLINQQQQLRMEKSRTVVDSLQKEIRKNLEKLDNL